MLWNRLAILFFLLHISLGTVLSTHLEEEHPFDLLIFTQQWPQTVCKEWKDTNPSHTCNFPNNPDSWTIHGVWPTKLHTMGPEFCNRSWHFDPEAVRPIENPLTELWTNIEGETKGYSLWAHEWSKHGTCAAVLEPLNSEYKYFSNGLDWMHKYSMLEILNAHNIVPSDDKVYSIVDIHKAVTDTLNVNPAIECRKIEGKSWLVEIRICFNKTLHLTDCDGVLLDKHRIVPGPNGFTDILTNCNVNENIVYPKDINPKAPPQSILLELYKFFTLLQWFSL